jgi:ribosomal protein S12 methylthiotransferase accessory factor
MYSFGAHPRFDVALTRTLTELLQGWHDVRALQSITVIDDLALVNSRENHEVHFIDSSGSVHPAFLKVPSTCAHDWHHQGSNEEFYQGLVAQCEKIGYSVYCADYEALGVYACRIIIPGMSEIYPISDLYTHNANRGCALRPFFCEFSQLTERELRAAYACVSDEIYQGWESVLSLIGLGCVSDEVWQSITITELRAMVALGLGDWDEVYIETDSLLSETGKCLPERRQLWEKVWTSVSASDLADSALTAELEPHTRRLLCLPSLRHILDTDRQWHAVQKIMKVIARAN